MTNPTESGTAEHELSRAKEQTQRQSDLLREFKGRYHEMSEEITTLRNQKTILLEACEWFLRTMNTNGNWEGGHFYYRRMAAPELQVAIEKTQHAITASHP